MTDREKLANLLHSGRDNYFLLEFEANLLADHLMKHGVVVREKGEWEIRVDDYDNELMWCPFCHEEFYDGENDTVDHTPNFCPNCGADMRGAVNDG